MEKEDQRQLVDKDELRRLVEEALSVTVRQTVHEVFVSLGIDTKDPIRTQRDFAVMEEARRLIEDAEFRADLTHLRRWRVAMDRMQTQSLVVTVGMLITGAVALLFMGIKSQILVLMK